MTGIKIFYLKRCLWQGDDITEGRQMQNTNFSLPSGTFISLSMKVSQESNAYPEFFQ